MWAVPWGWDWRGQGTASGLVEFGLIPWLSPCFLSQSLMWLEIYGHPLHLPGV